MARFLPTPYFRAGAAEQAAVVERVFDP